MTRATVATRAPFIARESASRGLTKREVALDVAGRAAVQSLEDTFSVVRTKLVEQVVRAQSPGFDVCLLPKEIRHGLRELAVVGHANGSPDAGAPQESSLPPPPQRGAPR